MTPLQAPTAHAPPEASTKAPTGIIGFDELTGGGLPHGRTTKMTAPQQSEPAMGNALSYRFRLYDAGDGTNSVQATANLAAICRPHLAGRSETEIVDIFQEPVRVLEDGVFMSPTLLKLVPVPARKFVSTLSQMSSSRHCTVAESAWRSSPETPRQNQTISV